MSDSRYVPRQNRSGEIGYKEALFGVAALLLGLLVSVLDFFALMM